ncbi:MAG: membrane protein insertase YidC [Alphaproteobacteria bacterium]|nr:membrane protein insertase YidC [Alphaproteobacteria bacterium]
MDRNTILAIVLSAVVLIGWQVFIAGPQQRAYEAAQAAQQQAAQAEQAKTAPAPGTAPRPAESGLPTLSVAEALAKAPGRVEIDSPALIGSINLMGARIDDLRLKNYHETVDKKSPLVRLLSPRETKHGHYMQEGWSTSASSGESAVWTAPPGARLTPQTPVTLTRREGGLVFEKTFSIDKEFMFTVKQTVRNEGSQTEAVTPYGLVVQRNIPDGSGKYSVVREGPVAVVDNSLLQRLYKKMAKGENVPELSGTKGWAGITNKYWLAAAIPPQGKKFTATLQNVGTAAEPIFQASYALDPVSLAPGQSTTLTSYLFGGAKVVDTLQAYEKSVDAFSDHPSKDAPGVWDLDKSVDWGTFIYPLTRPIFWTLNLFYGWTGNFGVAIMMLVLVIKVLTYPLANQAFASMAKMKKLQPEIKKLQERYADDKMKLQQEMMALYKKEKMNPLAGCIPIFIQMPIFYSLYKTLFVTIELRHAPFILWIKDLSAPDPTSVFNLFGLLPFDPTTIPFIGAFLGIGVLPLFMGAAMWIQTQLNPPPTDPTQKQIFAAMPIVFTFLFGQFAAGLVLYWFWNTALSVVQQYIIMKRNGVEVHLMNNLKLPWAAKNSAASGK